MNQFEGPTLSISRAWWEYEKAAREYLLKGTIERGDAMRAAQRGIERAVRQAVLDECVCGHEKEEQYRSFTDARIARLDRQLRNSVP